MIFADIFMSVIHLKGNYVKIVCVYYALQSEKDMKKSLKENCLTLTYKKKKSHMT